MAKRKKRPAPSGASLPPVNDAPVARPAPLTAPIAVRLPWLIPCLLILASLALYGPSLNHPLVFDDRFFREEVLRLYSDAWLRMEPRWLSYLTFFWNHELFGNQWWAYRTLNVLLHGATASVLFLFLNRLFQAVMGESPRSSLDSRRLAFFGALLFLAHPAAVYGVAYLVQRPIIMATLFGLLSLLCFLEGLLRKSLPWHFAAAAAYFLAVFSKEHSVMLPAVALAMAFLIRGGSLRLARELAIPGVLFAAIGLLIVFKTRTYLGVAYEPLAAEMMTRIAPAGVMEDRNAHLISAVNQGFLFFRYLLTWLIPLPAWMSIDLRPALASHFMDWPPIAGFGAYLLYPIIAIVLLRKRGVPGLAGFALLFPWLLSLTEMATVRFQEPFVLYRSYLWMSGLMAALPALMGRFPARWALAALAGVCVILVPLTLNRLDSFSSRIKLWDDVVRKNRDETAPYVERGYHNRGFAMMQAGRYLDALRDFDKALAIHPRDADAYLGRGTLRTRTGSHEDALQDLDRAIDIDPGYAEAYTKRCVVHAKLERLDQAVADCEKAVTLDPRHRDAFTNLGVIQAARRETAKAEMSYRRALEIDDRNGDANYNYGVLLADLGRRDEAVRHLALACDKRVPDACEYLAEVRKGQ